MSKRKPGESHYRGDGCNHPGGIEGSDKIGWDNGHARGKDEPGPTSEMVNEWYEQVTPLPSADTLPHGNGPVGDDGVLRLATANGYSWSDFLAVQAAIPNRELPSGVTQLAAFDTANTYACFIEMRLAGGQSFDEAAWGVLERPIFEQLYGSDQFRDTVFGILNQYWAYTSELKAWRQEPLRQHFMSA